MLWSFLLLVLENSSNFDTETVVWFLTQMNLAGYFSIHTPHVDWW